MEFAKIFLDPESGRQILAVRRDLRGFGPSILFTTKMEDGSFMDRVYFAGDDAASVAALDEYFADLTLEVASYQIAKTIAEHGITGKTGDKPREIEGGANTTVGGLDDNPEEEDGAEEEAS
jgi:hypothetical protein